MCVYIYIYIYMCIYIYIYIYVSLSFSLSLYKNIYIYIYNASLGIPMSYTHLPVYLLISYHSRKRHLALLAQYTCSSYDAIF